MTDEKELRLVAGTIYRIGLKEGVDILPKKIIEKNEEECLAILKAHDEKVRKEGAIEELKRMQECNRFINLETTQGIIQERIKHLGKVIEKMEGV